MKVAGRWRYAYRAIDQFGQVIDAFVSTRRNATAARRLVEHAIGTTKTTPMEVVTDPAPVYRAVLDALLPAAWHRTEGKLCRGVVRSTPRWSGLRLYLLP